MAISPGTLQLFFGHKRELIPISPNPPHALKRPLHDGWTTKTYPHNEIQEYARQGYNLGWRLSPTDLVIDIDPRNDTLGGHQVLTKDVRSIPGFENIHDLSDVFPTVHTGGGGVHYYASIPPNIKIKNTTQRYGKGVEFKTYGRQVIIPGSMHPSGHVYEFDDFSDYMAPSTPLPARILEHIKRVDDYSQHVGMPGMPGIPSDIVSNDELAKLLSQLDPLDYSTNEEWFPLMASAHEMTNGQGLETFLSWSLKDSAFAGHDHIIRQRWLSFQPNKHGNISARTLYKEVLNHGGTLPSLPMQALDQINLGDLPPAPERQIEKPRVITIVDRQAVDRALTVVNPNTPTDELKPLLTQIASMKLLDQDWYLRRLSAVTKRSKKALKQTVDFERRNNQKDQKKTVTDLSVEIVDKLLAERFDNGKRLIHGIDQRYWVYSGTHWSPIGDNMISQYMLSAIEEHQTNEMDKRVTTYSLLTQSEKFIRAKCATDVNLHVVPPSKPPVINTLNCEVWLDPSTGLIETKEHTPESLLTSCLPVEFNPNATCPIFSKALDQIFSLCPDTQDVIRHLWEIIGYVIQPRKNLAAWVLFRGEGANGKTVILNVLTALLGDACMNVTSIDDINPKRNNHALEDLPGKLCIIDEDLDAQATLPDSILKKVSESKMLKANPKGHKAFMFENTAIPILASNPWPRVKDLSNGMRRRAHVFEFQRTFRKHEQDRTLAKRVINNELGGVLIEALRGFRRLQIRGNWHIPYSCKAAYKRWLSQSNTLVEFLSERIEQTKGTETRFSEVYTAYHMWCLDNGYKHQITKPSFRKSIVALGFTLGRDRENMAVIKNLILKNESDN